jgi:uncharacterized protein YuzE
MLMIDISIDLEVQAAYVQFSHGEYGRIIEVDESTNVDVASDGTVLGVEFLYFGNLDYTAESLKSSEIAANAQVIEAILKAQKLLIKKLSTSRI